MDLNTGKIVEIEDEKATLSDIMIAIDMADATEKQKKEMQVSLHDRRSNLGKKLTEERAKAGLTHRRYRNFRKKGKLK